MRTTLDLRLALRFLAGHQSRTRLSYVSLISILGIAISVGTLILVVAVMSGFQHELQHRIVGADAPIQIDQLGGVDQPAKLAKRISTIPDIRGAASFLSGQGLNKIHREHNLVFVIGSTSDLLSVTTLSDYLNTPSSTFPSASQVWIGSEMATHYGYKLGDRFSLHSPDTGRQRLLQVSGIFSTGVYTMDAKTVFIAMPTARLLFGKGRSVTGLKVGAEPDVDIQMIKARIQESIGDSYQVTTWLERHRSLVGALEIEKKLMVLLIGLMIVVGCFSISATLTIHTMKKTKSIGILTTIGASPGRIRRVFILQGIILGATGVGLGIGLGLLSAHYVNPLSDLLTTITGTALLPQDIYYFDRIPTAISFQDILLIGIYALGLCILAAVYPAYRASRLDAVEAIRS